MTNSELGSLKCSNCHKKNNTEIIKQKFREITDLKKEIAHDKMRLAQLENNISNNLSGAPIGALTEQLKGYRTAIKQNISRCCTKLEAAQQLINSIEDSEMRRIFTLYYIHGWSWQRVAFAIGLNSEASARIKHNRFLKSL